MSIEVLTVVCALCAYLLGAMNPAIVLSTTIYRKDIRGLGSGNPGFTNFLRVFGKKWAWLVMVLDLGKSALLCTVFGFAFREVTGSFQLGAAVAEVFAVIGHCFPIWYGFKGGKGFLAATMAMFFIDWRAGLIALAVLLLLFFTVHIMSVASILSVICAVVAVALLGYDSIWVLACAGFSALLVILRHGENIRRLVNGTEKKLYLKRKSS